MNNHLYRSRDDRMLAGVAGGLADLWDADPSLVRIVWALLVVLTGGIALVVYIVMAIVVPEEDGVAAWGRQTPGWAPGPGTSSSPARDAAPPVAAGSPPAGSPPAGPPPPPAGPPPADWRLSRFEAREARRDARRDARAARRADRDHGGRSGAIVVGALLVLLGAWFLVREFLPTVDWDWFWPLILVALGVVVLVLAIRPRSDGPGASGSSGGGSSGS